MNKNSKEIRCSFCGAGKQDSLMLIAGLDAHICDKCVNQANEILAEELKVRKVKASPSSPAILKPAEIKATSTNTSSGRTTLRKCWRYRFTTTTNALTSVLIRMR
jgi:ATP-dependent protease Clp ATPase subunit